MQPTLETDLLRTFVAIVETGSFTEASNRVGRSQAAVSMQMRRLENIIMRPLFERKGRSISLTHDGDTLLVHARRILRIHQDVLSTFSQTDLSGTITFGALEDYTGSLLPGVMARFTQMYPNIRVDMIWETPTNLNTLTRTGKVDLTLLRRPLGQENGTTILREANVWVTSAQHQAHEIEPLALALYPPGCLMRQWILPVLAAQQRPYRIAYTCLSHVQLVTLIRHGLALTAIGANSIPSGLKIIDEHDGFPPLPEFVLTLQSYRRRKSKIIDCLSDYLLENLRTLFTVQTTNPPHTV